MERVYPIALREWSDSDGKQCWTFDVAGRPIMNALVLSKPVTAQVALPLVIAMIAKHTDQQ